MYKVSLIFIVMHLLYGCSNFQNNSNDSLYNAFEDDFFEGSNTASASSENNDDASEENDETREPKAAMQRPDIMSKAYDYEDSLEDVYEEGYSALDADIENNFAGDNYIFSFSIGQGESLRGRMQELLEPYGYKLVWKSDLGVYFENDVLYEDRLLVNILKNISNDLSDMGIDIHINVYLKNKVVLVYSVRS